MISQALMGSASGLGAAVSAVDAECAEPQRGLVYAAAAGTITGAGVGLFGVYKLFKGRPAVGVTSLLGAGLVWFLGSRMAVAAATGFEECRKAHPAGALVPGAPSLPHA